MMHVVEGFFALVTVLGMLTFVSTAAVSFAGALGKQMVSAPWARSWIVTCGGSILAIAIGLNGLAWFPHHHSNHMLREGIMAVMCVGGGMCHMIAMFTLIVTTLCLLVYTFMPPVNKKAMTQLARLFGWSILFFVLSIVVIGLSAVMTTPVLKVG